MNDGPDWDPSDLPAEKSAWLAEFDREWVVSIAWEVTTPESIGEFFKSYPQVVEIPWRGSRKEL